MLLVMGLLIGAVGLVCLALESFGIAVAFFGAAVLLIRHAS